MANDLPLVTKVILITRGRRLVFIQKASFGAHISLVYSSLSANKALLLSNLGRLMRICAQAVGGVESKTTGRRGEFSQEERGYFNKVG